MNVLFSSEARRIYELLNTGKICAEQARDMLIQVASDDAITTLYANDMLCETFINYKKRPVYAEEYEGQKFYRVRDNASIQDIAWLLRNGDISYADALHWCQAYDVSEVWLHEALSPTVAPEVKKNTADRRRVCHLTDILFKIVEILNRIVDWILEDFI